MPDSPPPWILDLPQITWRPLPVAQPVIWPIQMIVHTAVSEADSLFDWFNGPSNGNESHVYVRGDGIGEQYMDAEERADANGAANRWFDPVTFGWVGAFSVETWDNGDPANTPWTAPQLDTLADIALWLNRTYQVPLAICATPTSPGLGWHSMWPKPNPWSPGNHTCPGPLRVAQFTDQLIPLIHRKETQTKMATQLTGTEIKNYVDDSFAAAANDDSKGRRYWVRTAGKSDDPWAVFTEMDSELGLP